MQNHDRATESESRGGQRRIVITGMGAVTPLGCGAGLVWRRISEGRSGIRRLADDYAHDVNVRVAGLVPTPGEDAEGGFDLAPHMEPAEARRTDRFIHLALVAAAEALGHAGWRPVLPEERERTATLIGTAFGGLGMVVDAVNTVSARGARRLMPYTVPSLICNLAAGHVSIRNGLAGPIGTPVTACAASLQAISDAARLIRAGEADVAIAGGSESCLGRLGLGSFAAARALSASSNDAPGRACRPFDVSRDGFVMSEGAVMVVVEELGHAQARGAEPLAEIVGYGGSADAHHVTGPPEDGNGALRAMRAALRMAGMAPSDVGHVSAHATGTVAGDRAELAALRALFGEGHLPPVSATKGATGHLMGAAGALATLLTVSALREGLLPPTLNLAQPEGGEAAIVGPTAMRSDAGTALVNALGFGGVNASLALRRWDGVTG